MAFWWNKDCKNDFKCVFNVFLRFDCCESVSVVLLIIFLKIRFISYSFFLFHFFFFCMVPRLNRGYL